MKDFGAEFFKLFEFSNTLESYDLKIVLLLAVGFTLASILGYLALRIKVSPILGYLLAGYFVGPYSPGFVVDIQLAKQLAEVGVILMMFGVGLNFKLQDLIKVKSIAIPGALIQTFLSALLSLFVVHFFGWPLKTGIILGLAIGVSSTVVLFRMLGEHNLLNTKEGHITVGWLVVEDIITVLILLLLPCLSTLTNGTEISWQALISPIAIVLIKFFIIVFVLLKFSKKVVSYMLSKVLVIRSHELFTLSILALIFLTATITSFFCGISIALGAFMAGMVIRQTKMHHKALIHSLPMRDAFISIFFLSVGMLFNPIVIINNISAFTSVLAIIIIAKPIIAFFISKSFGHSFKTAITIAIALMQIGEFSFILAEESMKFGFMSNEGYDIIVACSLISIAINPLFFKFLHKKKKQT